MVDFDSFKRKPIRFESLKKKSGRSCEHPPKDSKSARRYVQPSFSLFPGNSWFSPHQHRCCKQSPLIELHCGSICGVVRLFRTPRCNRAKNLNTINGKISACARLKNKLFQNPTKMTKKCTKHTKNTRKLTWYVSPMMCPSGLETCQCLLAFPKPVPFINVCGYRSLFYKYTCTKCI